VPGRSKWRIEPDDRSRSSWSAAPPPRDDSPPDGRVYYVLRAFDEHGRHWRRGETLPPDTLSTARADELLGLRWVAEVWEPATDVAVERPPEAVPPSRARAPRRKGAGTRARRSWTTDEKKAMADEADRLRRQRKTWVNIVAETGYPETTMRNAWRERYGVKSGERPPGE
jgi:hypothetical protein